MKTPKYLSRDFDRHGNERWYVRPPGRLKTRLPGGPAHPHFQKAYAAALLGESPNRARNIGAVRRARKLGSGFVYFLRVGAHVKIGFSRNPVARLEAMSTALTEPITSFVLMPGTMAMEKALHQAVESRRTSGEWYRADGLLIRLIAHAAAYGRLPGDLSHRDFPHQPGSFSPAASA